MMLGHHHQSVSAASQPASQYLRLTTYDFLAFYWDSPPPAVSHSVQSLSAASQHLRRFPSYDLRLMTSQLCFTGTHHHQQPTTTSSLSLTQFNCSLRLVTTRLTFNRSLRLTTYDLRLTTYDIPALLYWDPPTTSSLSVQYLSQEPANTYSSIRISTKKADIPTQHNLSQQPAKTLRRFLPSYDLQLTSSTGTHTHTSPLSEYPLRKQTSQHLKDL